MFDGRALGWGRVTKCTPKNCVNTIEEPENSVNLNTREMILNRTVTLVLVRQKGVHEIKKFKTN